MANFYQDTDAGSDANDGTTWALARLTAPSALGLLAAGDDLWTQGATDDTAAATRVLSCAGTVTQPCKWTGVVDGTTNEPPVLADIAVTLPKVSCTGGGSDITFSGTLDIANIHLTSTDKLNSTEDRTTITNGKVSGTDNVNSAGRIVLINTVFEKLSVNFDIEACNFDVRGGSWLFTTGGSVCAAAAADVNEKTFTGVDFSGLTTSFTAGSGGESQVSGLNCEVPSGFTLYGSTPNNFGWSEFKGCSDDSSVANTDSIQDYLYEDVYGNIDLETTAVRTGGANDDASGAFAYAMTPRASSTLESSSATLKSPWMPVWIDGGSATTLTIHIANDSASTDYNEDEVWCEFYTPAAGDTAQYDQNFDPAGARLFASSTAVTDDTGSTWGTGANNHQKMSATVTPGYTGYAYMRLHLAKRSATPDTLFLDPEPVIS